MKELKLDVKTESFMIEDKSYPIAELLKLPNLSAEFGITIEEVEAFLKSMMDDESETTKNIEAFLDKLAEEQMQIIRDKADQEIQSLNKEIETVTEINEKNQKAIEMAQEIQNWFDEKDKILRSKYDAFFGKERAARFWEINEKIQSLRTQIENENDINLAKAKAAALRSYQKQLENVFKNKAEWEVYMSTLAVELRELKEELGRRIDEFERYTKTIL